MKNFFNILTGNNLYDYQAKVASDCLDKKNIFLCAPTGAGKTWAALIPYLWAKKNKIEFTDRLIYVLPLRTLATILYSETISKCKKLFDVKNFVKERTYKADELIITIQTGEQKDDPFFEGDIIFTTVDQCLSSYINCPVSIPKKLANINAGALPGSLIVFDEFHLLEPDKAMTTAIEMIQRLKPFSQFIIMTATLTTKSMNSLKEIIDGEVIRLNRDEVLCLPSHKEKKRTYCWINRPLNIDDILKYHNNKRSIVILNTVTRAQSIYKELINRLKDTKTTFFLLHSRFYSEDRKATEEKLKEWFGKEASKTNVILVTTQVVEAGIDISADNLHTELAPLNSIIQRAGRSARYEKDRGIGNVWIYELEKTEKGQLKLGPYRSKDQMDLVVNTRTIFEQLSEKGKVLDFMEELERLDKVHSEYEAKYLKAYKQNLSDLKNKIHEAMDGIHKTAIRDLIRDTASVNVIIYNNPDSLKFDKDKWPRMISVPRSSLYTLTPFFEECRDFGETVAWYPTEENNFIDDNNFSFRWERVSSKDQIKDIEWLIVINPKFAFYSPKIGLQIGLSGHYDEPQYFDRPITPFNKICYETYSEHVHKVIYEYKQMRSQHQNTIKHLSCYYNMSPDQLQTLAEFACAFHDVGKLSVKWQKVVKEWQQIKNPQKLTDEPIAHSDYDPKTDFEEKKKFSKQPPHASEGAYAISAFLSDCFKEYAIPVYTAIARHHGAFTESLGDFKLINEAEKWVNQTLLNCKKINLVDNPNIIEKENDFKDNLLCFSKNDEKFWPLYSYIVRMLRLADQKSQKGGIE